MTAETYEGFHEIPIEDGPPGEGIGKSYTNGQAKGDEPPPLPLAVLLDDLKLSREVFWAIDDRLPRVEQMLLYGPGGSGKTYLASSIAIGIAQGRWFDHEAEQGTVLCCAFERPADAEDRFAAIRDRHQFHGLPVALLKLPGYGMSEIIADHIVAQGRSVAEKTSNPVKAVIIDTTSAALGGGKEDDQGLGWLKVVGERIAAELKAMVIWIHHEGKADHNGPRGHLVLAESCALWWWVEEREDGSRVVHVQKANRGPSHMPLFAFRLPSFVAGQDQRGKDIALCDIELVELETSLASPPKKRFGRKDERPDRTGKGPNQKRLASDLGRLANRHPAGVELGDLRSAFICGLNHQRQATGEPLLDKNRSARTFRQTLEPMVDAGLVERLANGLLLPGPELAP